MKHMRLMSMIESLSSLADSPAGSLVSRMTAGNRSDSYRTENAASCILMCYNYEKKLLYA